MFKMMCLSMNRNIMIHLFMDFKVDVLTVYIIFRIYTYDHLDDLNNEIC
jgi:hypothetical protein